MKDKGLFRMEIEVSPEEIDENGHVNNVVFIQWMQDIAVAHSLDCDGTDAMKRAGGTWVVRSHRIRYLRPAFQGDRVEASTWVVNFRGIISLRRYRFTRKSGGDILAEGETDWVFVDLDSGRPRRIPEEVSSCFPLVPDME